MPDHDADRAAGLIRRIASILDRYGIEDRAEFARSTIGPGTGDTDWSTVAGLEFWGGSGALWEIEPFEYSHPSVDGSAAGTDEFRRSMIELSELLEERGMAHLSRRNAELLRRLADSQ